MKEKVAVGNTLGLIVDDLLTAFVLVDDKLLLCQKRNKAVSNMPGLFYDITTFVKFI